MEPSPPSSIPPSNHVNRALESLKKEYVLVGKTRVKAWYAWLVIGLAVGIITGIALVANRTGEVEKGRAADIMSQQTSGEIEFGMPFGSNNAYLSDLQETDIWLKDLGIALISDHLPPIAGGTCYHRSQSHQD